MSESEPTNTDCGESCLFICLFSPYSRKRNKTEAKAGPCKNRKHRAQCRSPGRLQIPKYFSHHLFPPRVCISRNYTGRGGLEVDLGTLIWDVNVPGSNYTALTSKVWTFQAHSYISLCSSISAALFPQCTMLCGLFCLFGCLRNISNNQPLY